MLSAVTATGKEMLVKGKREDEEVMMGRFGVKESNLDK